MLVLEPGTEASKQLTASYTTMTSSICLALFFCFFTLFSSFTEADQNLPPPVNRGLSYTFYGSICPNLEITVRNYLRNAICKDAGLAAGLLRLHFHDCFVQGCDASVLLDGSASGPGEQNTPPNLSLRPSALKTIDDIRALVHKHCGRVVSCADITALAARDSVFLAGGPDYRVPLGRRDGRSFATLNEVLASLPAPFSNATVLLAAFARLKFDANDLVALSGGHTIGIGHCSSFSNRLFPSQDPTMDKNFAYQLYKTCPSSNSPNTTVLDIRSPNTFDNKYYVDLLNRQGLFTSDQDLYTDLRTRDIVTSFALNQTKFFEQFAASMVKMGQLGVLTGGQGEIRSNCSTRNSGSSSQSLWTVVEEGEGISATF